MKYLFIAFLLIMVSCNNTPKKVEVQSSKINVEINKENYYFFKDGQIILKTEAIKGCVKGMTKNSNTVAIDNENACACIFDKFAVEFTVEELINLTSNNSEIGIKDKKAVAEIKKCISENIINPDSLWRPLNEEVFIETCEKQLNQTKGLKDKIDIHKFTLCGLEKMKASFTNREIFSASYSKIKQAKMQADCLKESSLQ